MTRHDFQPFLERLLETAEFFDTELSSAKQRMWFEAVADLEYAVVASALKRARSSATFMPKPAEIRGFIDGSPDDQGEVAWEQIRAAAKKVGGYRSVWIESSVTAQALSATFGTWIDFCSVELEEPMWAAKRKEFLAAFRASARRSLPADAVRYLVGRAEQHNRLHAHTFNRGPKDAYPQHVGLLLANGHVQLIALRVSALTGAVISDVPALAAGQPEKLLPVAPSEPARSVLELVRSRVKTMPALPSAGCASCGMEPHEAAHRPGCEVVADMEATRERLRLQAAEFLAEPSAAPRRM